MSQLKLRDVIALSPAYGETPSRLIIHYANNSGSIRCLSRIDLLGFSGILVRRTYLILQSHRHDNEVNLLSPVGDTIFYHGLISL